MNCVKDWFQLLPLSGTLRRMNVPPPRDPCYLVSLVSVLLFTTSIFYYSPTTVHSINLRSYPWYLREIAGIISIRRDYDCPENGRVTEYQCRMSIEELELVKQCFINIPSDPYGPTYTRAPEAHDDGPLFVLLISGYYDTFISVAYHEYAQYLVKNHNWKMLSPPSDEAIGNYLQLANNMKATPGGANVSAWELYMNDLVEHYGRLPDVLLFFGMSSLGRLGNREERAKSPVRCQNGHPMKAMYWDDDIHYLSTHPVGFRTFLPIIDIVACPYAYHIKDFFPDEAKGVDIHVLPHSASPTLLTPPRSTVSNRVLLLGVVTQYYTQRLFLLDKLLKGDARLAQLLSMWNPTKRARNETLFLGSTYGCAMNSFIATITDTSQFGETDPPMDPIFRDTRYILAKTVEIPASGSLLLIDDLMVDLLREHLHYEPYHHYIPYNRSNVDDVIDYVLNPYNRATIDIIRQNGFKMVKSKHLSYHRAAELHRIAMETYSQE